MCVLNGWMVVVALFFPPFFFEYLSIRNRIRIHYAVLCYLTAMRCFLYKYSILWCHNVNTKLSLCIRREKESINAEWILIGFIFWKFASFRFHTNELWKVNCFSESAISWSNPKDLNPIRQYIEPSFSSDRSKPHDNLFVHMHTFYDTKRMGKINFKDNDIQSQYAILAMSASPKRMLKKRMFNHTPQRTQNTHKITVMKPKWNAETECW